MSNADAERHGYRARISEIYKAAKTEGRPLKDKEIRELTALSNALAELPEKGVTG